MGSLIDPLVCTVCAESGLPPGRLYDPQTRTVVLCAACWPARVARWAVPLANIYPKYRTASFDDIEPQFPSQKDAIDQCRAYARDWPRVKASGRTLGILGRQPGMGKSHLASAICNDLIERWWTTTVETERQDVCLFLNVSDWFASWNEHHLRFPWSSDPKSGANEVRAEDPEFRAQRKRLTDRDARMKRTELLVLDDLTKMRLSHDNLDKLFGVVEYRVSRGLPVVVTDNSQSWTEVSNKLGDEFGPPITDRFIRSGDTIVIEMPLRRTKRQQKEKIA